MTSYPFSKVLEGRASLADPVAMTVVVVAVIAF
jgi:hypothetical protein